MRLVFNSFMKIPLYEDAHAPLKVPLEIVSTESADHSFERSHVNCQRLIPVRRMPQPDTDAKLPRYRESPVIRCLGAIRSL
jgi:hypothetical protein